MRMTYVKVFIVQLLVIHLSEGQKEGDLRVSDGQNAYEGRLEIYKNGRWGTICRDGFDTPDARVACRQLTNRNERNASYYTAGGGTGTIWMSNLACNGKEWKLNSCTHRGQSDYNCNHDEDIGVRCSVANEGDLRVSNGGNSREGRLEIYHNGLWGTICENDFGLSDALVACRQLTNRNERNASYYTASGGTGTIWMDHLDCSGKELKLNRCSHAGWGDHNCDHYKDVGVRCHLAEEGDLQMSDGSNSREGRLEIYHLGRWGTICNKRFGSSDALVACRQLTNGKVRTSSYYTASGGTGKIWISNLACRGRELKLNSCYHGGWGHHSCNHDKDVGIRCNVEGEGELRVSDGSNSREGRLEIYHKEHWGTICYDRFGTSDALVACRQLTNQNVRMASYYTASGGTGQIWMDNIACSGREWKLHNCPHGGWGDHNCNHGEVVGIRCYLADEGELRVSDGNNTREGRLEIYHNGRWGTICDHEFGTSDALVACRQLTNRNVREASYYTAGGGTGTIWIDKLACSGRESKLHKCSRSIWGYHHCNHDQDVGIRCSDSNEGDLRVSDGSNSREGRLEIYHNERWGTICDDKFGTSDALVACRQLTNRNVRSASFYTAGGGTGTIWMSNITCSGREWKLNSCFHGQWADHNCNHDKDVGIRCYVASEGDLRVSDGKNPREGRLEIYHSGRWGTICKTGFGTLDALVACRQITNRNVRNAYYYTAGGGTGSIWMDNLACSGREWTLTECSHAGWGYHHCNHEEDIGINCYDANKGNLRVSDGKNSEEGRLEIYHNGQWGTICDDHFGTSDARVACRQLTNRNVNNPSYYTAGGGTGTIWMDSLACIGRELALDRCSHAGWGNHDCTHNEDVGIRCSDASEGDLRVSGGINSEEGRLEIYHNGHWGTICDDKFGTSDARVACRQITNRNVRNASYYTAGGGSGTIWMDSLSCNGRELKLNRCFHDGWSNHDCTHDEDVGIRCYDANKGDLRVSGGNSFEEGRLEIYNNRSWGTICDDDFGTSDALVACRQLTNRKELKTSYYTAGGGTGTIWMDSLACNGSESMLISCSHAGWGDHNCNHDEDVGIRCYATEEGDLCVSGGNNSEEGRLEVYHNGRWGTICDDDFDRSDALVACRQLTNRNVRNAYYYTAGGGTGTIWIDDLACSGREWELTGCSHGRWGDHNCNHDEDVGIRCYVAHNGDLRVSVGKNSLEGRLEIYYNGWWGTICDDDFGTSDALVACRQLTDRNVRNASYSTVGGGTGTIWMNNLACSGREGGLTGCSHGGWGDHNCSHDEDVGIQCYVANEGDLRVSSENNVRNGRLDIYHNERWGTICGDGFGTFDALVACRQLTHRNVKSASYYTAGGGTGTIWIGELACNGSERTLKRCSHGGWGHHNCTHKEDVGIRCHVEDDVQGNWGPWMSWNSCSRTCNNDYRKKRRNCNNPTPSSGRSYCLGASFHINHCNNKKCQDKDSLITVIVLYTGAIVGVFIGFTAYHGILNLRQRRRTNNTSTQNTVGLSETGNQQIVYREVFDLPRNSRGREVDDIATSAV